MLILAAVLAGGALTCVNLHWGELNQDEGWYLYAARSVAEGAIPYRDFAFTQGPVWPYVYALMYPVVEAWGLAGGRVATAILGWLSILLASALAARLTGKGRGIAAAVATLILLAVNVYHSYFTTIVKTYSLSAVFVTAAALLLSHAGGRRAWSACCAAGVALALATGVRISMGILFPVVAIYLFSQRRILPPGAWLVFTLSSIAGLLIVYAPFAALAPENFQFWVIQYHTERHAGSLLSALVYKAGFLSRWVQAYYLLFGVFAAALAWRCLDKRESGQGDAHLPPHFHYLIWLSALAVTFVHLAAPFPYDDYQAPVMPLFAALIASMLIGRTETDRSALIVLGVVLLLSLASAFSSPLNQAWAVRERDRIWWRLKESSDLRQLQTAGTWVAKHTDSQDLILTQDLYLAIEARRAVPRGLEMGPFSYFPEWTRERAERLNVLNREMLLELIESGDSPVAAISGYSLTIRCPEVVELPPEEQELLQNLLRAYYEPALEVPHFGQAYTTLRIWTRKP